LADTLEEQANVRNMTHRYRCASRATMARCFSDQGQKNRTIIALAIAQFHSIRRLVRLKASHRRINAL
jgi:hypothetical protein